MYVESCGILVASKFLLQICTFRRCTISSQGLHFYVLHCACAEQRFAPWMYYITLVNWFLLCHCTKITCLWLCNCDTLSFSIAFTLVTELANWQLWCPYFQRPILFSKTIYMKQIRVTLCWCVWVNAYRLDSTLLLYSTLWWNASTDSPCRTRNNSLRMHMSCMIVVHSEL